MNIEYFDMLAHVNTTTARIHGMPMLTLTMPAQKKPASAFGARLIALRKARRLTQVQLAEALGVKQSTISYYEAEAGPPAGELVIKLARVFGVTADDVLGTPSRARADQANPTSSSDERRYWRRFQQLMRLPEKDRRAVFRMLDTMTKASHGASGKTA